MSEQAKILETLGNNGGFQTANSKVFFSEVQCAAFRAGAQALRDRVVIDSHHDARTLLITDLALAANEAIRTGNLRFEAVDYAADRYIAGVALRDRSAREWQPIESAPKDEAVVVGSCPDGPYILWWFRAAPNVLPQWHDVTGQTHTPTHWMPLPLPPSREPV